MLPLVAGLLLLGGLGETAALALSGGREPRHNGTTATLDHRSFGIAVLSTKLDTIYLSGNPKKSRTADFGFHFRINGKVWAPCPITAGDSAEECPGMVGSCFDNLLCPDGCGPGLTGGTLPTLRCTEEGKQFCSTAYLTAEEVAPPVTSYACASDQSEAYYKGFTTELRVEDLITSTTISTSSDTATTRGSIPSSIAKSTEPPSTSSSGPTSGPDAESNSSSPANNIGAIIGGVAGCLALVCGFGLAAVWLLRRNRNAKAKAASSSSSASSSDGDGVSFEGKPELEAAGRRPIPTYERAELFGQSRSEMSARGPAAYDTSRYRTDDRPMTPVELPTTARAGWV